MATSVGIEIGPSVIRAARVERAGGQVRLLTVEEQPYEVSQADALGRALAQLRQSLRITHPVILGLPGFSAILSTLHPLVVNRQRAALAVQFELQQQLPFDVSQVAWHYQWLPQNGHPQVLNLPPRVSADAIRGLPQPAAIAAAMKRHLLDERLAMCRRAGLPVAGVSITAVALLNACYLQRSLSRAKALTLLHLIDGTTGEWIVWSPERLQVVPVTAQSPELLSQELAASWQGIQAQWPDASPSVWTVGADRSLTEVLSRTVGVQVQRFDPAQVVAMRTVRPEAAERATAAIGLALQGVGVVRLPLNLLDYVQRAQGLRWMRRASWLTAGVCAAATLLLGASGMLEVRQRRLRLLNSLEQRERVYQKLRPDLRTMLQHQQRTERLTAQLERVMVTSTVVTDTLAQVAHVLPETVWLTKVECAKGAAIEITLEGRTASFQEVTRLLDSLKGISGMTAVKPLSTTVVPAQPGGSARPPGPTIAPAGAGGDGDGRAGELVAFAVQLQRTLP